MVSISRYVEHEMKKRPFLQDALQRGIINYGGLADEILPTIEEQTGQQVKHSAVMMALRRLAEKLDKQDTSDVSHLHKCTLSARDGLVEITAKKNQQTQKCTRELLNHIEQDNGDFCALTHGIYETTIIVNKEHHKLIKTLFKKEIKSEYDKLSAISITVPDECLEGSGFFYSITKAFAWEQIPLKELVSTHQELICIVETKHVARAYQVLQGLLAKK